MLQNFTFIANRTICQHWVDLTVYLHPTDNKMFDVNAIRIAAWDKKSCEYISVPIFQNPSSSRLGKNELWVFSESLGPPPSSTTDPCGHSRPLKAQKMRFWKCVPVAFSPFSICQNTFPTPKHVPIAFGGNEICQNTFPSQNIYLFLFWQLE